jgi:quercetin dioxygenase-like cupin family protein
MSAAFQLNELPWEPVRPALVTGVFGRTMLDAGTKMVYTRVEPDGGFALHVDSYGHLLYILSGSGVARAGGSEYQLSPGLVLQIKGGEEHSYRNTGSEDLVLIALNIPA